MGIAKNTCSWLKVSSQELCGKNCVYEYCHTHRQQFRKDRIVKNTCPWLKIGSLELCGKSCIYEYCGTHRQQFRIGRKQPLPCRRCGCGTGSATRLCKSCGSHRIGQKLIDTERRARKRFVALMAQIREAPPYVEMDRKYYNTHGFRVWGPSLTPVMSQLKKRQLLLDTERKYPFTIRGLMVQIREFRPKKKPFEQI